MLDDMGERELVNGSRVILDASFMLRLVDVPHDEFAIPCTSQYLVIKL